MKMKLLPLILAMIATMNLFAQQPGQNNIVKEEASKNAITFLNLIPEGRENEYGFDGRNDFSNIKIEEPYQTFYIRNQGDPFTLVAGNEWRVPLSVDGKYKTLLTVRFNENKPEVVDLGGVLLSKKLQEFEHHYPVVAGRKTIIRNTFLGQDFLTGDFSSICTPAETEGLFTLNTNGTGQIYKISQGLPEQTSIASFCNATLEAIHSSSDPK